MLGLYTTGLTWITREGQTVPNPTFYIVGVFTEHIMRCNQLAVMRGATALDMWVEQRYEAGRPTLLAGRYGWGGEGSFYERGNLSHPG